MPFTICPSPSPSRLFRQDLPTRIRRRRARKSWSMFVEIVPFLTVSAAEIPQNIVPKVSNDTHIQRYQVFISDLLSQQIVRQIIRSLAPVPLQRLPRRLLLRCASRSTSSRNNSMRNMTSRSWTALRSRLNMTPRTLSRLILILSHRKWIRLRKRHPPRRAPSSRRSSRLLCVLPVLSCTPSSK